MLSHISVLLVIGSAIILAFLGGKFVNRWRFPMVTGYVIVGVILGKSFLNLITPETTARLSIFNDLALGIIALLIGGEFRIDRLKKLGKVIGSIAILESFLAFLFVCGVSFLFTHKIYYALILGAVASATAPAATVAVIDQYRAKGPLTTTVLGVVGSDDAIALIIYAFASGLARSFFMHTKLTFFSVIGRPFFEIILSMSLGAFLGYILGISIKKLKNRREIFFLTIGFLLLSEGIATQLHVSELLTVMAMGMVTANISPIRRFSEAMDTIDIAGIPIIAGFFCLAGTKLNIRLLPQIGILGLFYTIARMSGKWSGAFLGARISHAPESVQKYTGLSLFPQIGVAVALAVIVEKEFGKMGIEGHHLSIVVMNVLLFTTIITETIGPPLTKIALRKAGEIESEK